MLRRIVTGRTIVYKRAFSSFSSPKGYDILGEDSLIGEDRSRMSVMAFGDTLFQVNNVLLGQSVLLFPNKAFLWKPRKFEEITVESLAPVSVLYPTVEILFVGCGETNYNRLPREFCEYFRSLGIVVEQSTTSNAAATFNILNSEGRNVAAALLTLEPYPIKSKEIL